MRASLLSRHSAGTALEHQQRATYLLQHPCSHRSSTSCSWQTPKRQQVLGVRCNAKPTSSVDQEQEGYVRTTHYAPKDGPSTSSSSSHDISSAKSTGAGSETPSTSGGASYEALAAWVGAAVAFGAGIWYVQGAEKAQEFFAGYLLEQSLSVDNLFVFILVFKYFATPPVLQNKVLTYGIATAAVLRAVMIILGVELLTEFEPLLLVFAGILLFSSFQLLTASEDDDEEDLSQNFIVTFCQKLIKSSSSYDGDKFFTVENGARVATPLLLTLAVVELSDVVFAVDSIPAVFGVTLDPFIVYTSNIFAILSLRALYTFVSNIMSELRYLDKAVAVVLGFIGFKMILGFSHVAEIPTDVSLLVVASVLGGGVGASLLLPEPQESD